MCHAGGVGHSHIRTRVFFSNFLMSTPAFFVWESPHPLLGAKRRDLRIKKIYIVKRNYKYGICESDPLIFVQICTRNRTLIAR